VAERPFDIDRDERADAIARIRAYFERERDEPLGELGATLIFEFVRDELGPLFYNLGLDDARALIARSMDSLEADIDAARRLPPRGLPSAPRPTSDD